MSKKAIIRLVVLFVVLLSIIALIEIVVESIANKNKDNNQAKPVVRPTISETEKEREDTFIEETNDVLELFKNKDYETIYNKLSKKYKEAKYPSLQSFIDAMKKIIKDDSSIEIHEMINNPQGYYAVFLVDNEKKISLVVENLGQEDMTIVLDDVEDISSMQLYTGSSEVNIDFNYMIKYYGDVGYSINVKNLTNRSINFQIFKTSYEYTNSKYNKNKYFLDSEISETIDAKSSKLMEIKFPVPSNLFAPPDTLELYYGVGGKEYRAVLYVGYYDNGEDGDDL